MSEKKRVVAVCPDCTTLYWQEVPDGYDGPSKTPSLRETAIRAVLENSDMNNGIRTKYYLMRCTDCSVRLAPPALRETLRKWLQQGEKK